MDIGEIPTWLQSLGALIGTAGVAGWLAWKEKSKERSFDPDGIGDHGGKVVAASFVDKAALDKNTTTIEASNVLLARLCGFMERAEQNRHDEKIAKEAAQEALLLEKLRRQEH